MSTVLNYKHTNRQNFIANIYVRRFCTALNKRINHHIKLPSRTEAAELAKQNQKINKIPQIWGAIDGCHIAVTPPKLGYADYINRKMFPSLVLQGVVDCQYR